jgi:hypothetical protein
VCKSSGPIVFNANGPAFDTALCKTAKDKSPGSSQVTALVWGDLDTSEHRNGRYRIAFRATLVAPWQAKLVGYR